MNFPVSLDDLKNWYYGITSGNTWQRAGDQFSALKNGVSNMVQPDTSPTHGQPIQSPGMNLSDLWANVKATLTPASQSVAQPVNRSGSGK